DSGHGGNALAPVASLVELLEEEFQRFAGGGLMSAARRLRKPIAGAECQDVLDGLREVHAVPGRDEQRIGPISRPQHGTNDFRYTFASIVQVRVRACFFCWGLVVPAQARLSAANGGKVEQQSQVSRNPHPLGM